MRVGDHQMVNSHFVNFVEDFNHVIIKVLSELKLRQDFHHITFLSITLRVASIPNVDNEVLLRKKYGYVSVLIDQAVNLCVRVCVCVCVCVCMCEDINTQLTA